ncbi:MAG: 2-C-methyl-D-erythritol 4-phosphate cytidylyltransferase [Clostridia bacterium]|nr:2-C-methyl-D-erythritol 4-phosphate cytidylyltransferase [Clostridia bacterium]
MSENNATISVVIVAAGNSSRMGGVNKQFLFLGKTPVLVHSLRIFDNLSEIGEIILVTRSDDMDAVKSMLTAYDIKKVKTVVPGGASRQESVCIGLEAVACNQVLIHDGARPFASKTEILDVIDALKTYDAAVVGVPVKDTIKRVTNDGIVVETVPRDELVAVMTPQGFRTSVIREAYEKANADKILLTDDTSAAEYIGVPVKVIQGSYENIKITTPEDILYGEAICRERG